MKEKLMEILADICDEECDMDCDMDLFEEGVLDSLARVELLLAIEDTFGVTISPTEYDVNELSSINKILRVLEEKGAK